MDVDEPAYTYSDTVTVTLPLVAERQDGTQLAARGVLYWDASDPLVCGIHFEIMMNSVSIDPAVFVAPEGRNIRCLACREVMPLETMGALVEDESAPGKALLLCLMCADKHPGTAMEEAIWILGLAELEGVLSDESPPNAGAATVRIWRLNEDMFQIELTQGSNTLILTAPVERLELLLVAIREYESTHKEHKVEDYLDAGLAELEKLANQE